MEETNYCQLLDALLYCWKQGYPADHPLYKLILQRSHRYFGLTTEGFINTSNSILSRLRVALGMDATLNHMRDWKKAVDRYDPNQLNSKINNGPFRYAPARYVEDYFNKSQTFIALFEHRLVSNVCRELSDKLKSRDILSLSEEDILNEFDKNDVLSSWKQHINELKDSYSAVKSHMNEEEWNADKMKYFMRRLSAFPLIDEGIIKGEVDAAYAFLKERSLINERNEKDLLTIKIIDASLPRVKEVVEMTGKIYLHHGELLIKMMTWFNDSTR